MITLTELCREVNNWFKRSSYQGTFHIDSGAIDLSELVSDGSIQDGQYFRIIGSVFNDGVHQYKALPGETDELLEDETFTGIVSPMAIPKDFLTLFEEITTWLTTYGAELEKPYQSESFGGYTYSLKGSLTGSSGYAGSTDKEPWVANFASRLNKWRKL